MPIITNLLLLAHFFGVAMAVGGGIALSQVGPKLIAKTPNERAELWPLETFFSRLGSFGLLVLLISGPLMVWLKFDGVSGFNSWFWAKMALVVVAVLGVGLHDWAGARFRRGNEGASSLMVIGGRIAGASMVLVMLCAVFAFN